MDSSEDDVPIGKRMRSGVVSAKEEPQLPVKRIRTAKREPVSPSPKKPTKSRKSAPVVKSTKSAKPAKSPPVKAPVKTKAVKGRSRAKRESPGSGAEDSPAEEYERGDARKYFKEGQKNVCPPNGEASRSFYESLLRERPESLIAVKYTVENGCLAGTQLRHTLRKYHWLREHGYCGGNFAGGMKPEIVKELSDAGLLE